MIRTVDALESIRERNHFSFKYDVLRDCRLRSKGWPNFGRRHVWSLRNTQSIADDPAWSQLGERVNSGLVGVPMDTSAVEGRVSAALAEDLNARQTVFAKPHMDLRTLAVVLRLYPDFLCLFE